MRDIIPRLKQAGGAGNCGISAEQDRPMIRISAARRSGGCWRGGGRGSRKQKQPCGRFWMLCESAATRRCWSTRASSMGSTGKSRAGAGEVAAGGVRETRPGLSRRRWRGHCEYPPLCRNAASRRVHGGGRGGPAAGSGGAAARYRGGVHPGGPVSAALHFNDDGGARAGRRRAEYLRCLSQACDRDLRDGAAARA